jgi:uncharacterized protein (TIGR03437 family)
MGLLAFTPAVAQYRRGVNVAGAEFGMSNLPGTLGRDYTFNSEATFRYFAEKNLGLIRVPLQWERLQPILHAPLDADYLAGVKGDVGWAKAHGAEVILDIHNFARYRGNIASAADLADLWTRLSTEFKFERAVYAYNLMNEPHDMGTANWKEISQTVLEAIRANQDDKLIFVPGDSWSSANRWVIVHGGASWIQDPSNNFAYEAHQYFDHDESGTYTASYAAELAANPDLANVGSTRVQRFLDWCRANGVRGMLGEFGVPDTDPRWLIVMENFLQALDGAGVEATYWAAGEWWGSYPLSVQPTANFTVDRPQLTNLRAHAPGGYLAAYSAASASVARATPGSLVTIYGNWPGDAPEVTVRVTDAMGSATVANLLYAGAGQINFEMPLAAAPGRSRIDVLRSGLPVATGGIHVVTNAPAIFTANSTGYGLAAAQFIRVKPDGTQIYEVLSPSSPVTFGSDERIFLVLYGTGVRGSSATVDIGGVPLNAGYAGPQGQFAGLDQINLELPRSLAGAGLVDVKISVDGVIANNVQVAIQ